MPSIRLTRTAIDKLELIGNQTYWYDTKMIGFAVRVNAESKSYIVRTRVKGQFDAKGKPVEIRVTIGRVDGISWEKAIAKARLILDNALEGISPATQQIDRKKHALNLAQEALKQKALDVTLSEVFAEYGATKKTLLPSTLARYATLFNIYCPEWLPLPLRSIDSKMIIAKHAEAGERSKSQADVLMRVLRALFNFGMVLHEDAIIRNPVHKLNYLCAWYGSKRRTDYVLPGELSLFLPAVLRVERQTSRDFILMLLFTGCRRAEAGSLKWGDVSTERGSATFRDTKNGSTVEIPLAKYLLEMLETRRVWVADGADDYVFPSHSYEGGMRNPIKTYRHIAEDCGVLVKNHDLRRSFQSYCNILKVPVFTIKRLSSHSLPRDVSDGYIQHPLEDLRHEVERVADYILTKAGLKGGADVISLDSKRSQA